MRLISFIFYCATCVALFFLLVSVIPDMEQQYTARFNERQRQETLRTQAREESAQAWAAQAGATARVWAWPAAAGVVAGVAGWGAVKWQSERSKRHEVSEMQTTQRALIGSQRDVALAWIAANYPNAGYLPIERRPYVGVLDGVPGVFVPDLCEFVPADVARHELAAARLLTDQYTRQP